MPLNSPSEHYCSTAAARTGGDVAAAFAGVLIVFMPLVLVILAAWVQPVRAQDAPADEDEPLVERITFRGVEELSENGLRSSIVTQETSCRAMLMQPFCWVTDASLVVDYKRLNREELERDVVRLRVYYFRRGYREASVSAEIRSLDEGVEVIFHIQEREPILVRNLEVQQTSDVLSDRDIRRARLPDEGDPLSLENLEMGIADFEERLGSEGYLDAVVSDTIDVDSETRGADVRVLIDPGPRSTLAALDIRQNEDVSDGTIAEALRLNEGRVLRTTDIVAARRSLYESNLFHEVDVSVAEQADSAKRVDVTVREAPPRTVRVGGGFNTVDFVQVEGRFTHYNWLGGGRRMEIRGTLGNLLAPQLNDRVIFRDVLPEQGFGDEAPYLRPTWQASIGFMQPAFQSAENVLGIDLFANRNTIPGIVVDQGYGAEVSVTRRIDYDTHLSVAYAFELTGVDAGDLYFCVNYGVCELGTIEALRGTNAMSPITLTVRTDRADNPLAPTSGHRARVDLEHSSRFTASDFRYNRVSGEASYYLPLDVHRTRILSGRVRVGWVRHLSGVAEAIGINLGEDEEALLHPRKRFYAGGSSSVRGYGENQLGPQTLTIDPAFLLEADDGCTSAEIEDGTCDPGAVSMEEFVPRPIGGSAVLEGSVEYRLPFVWGLTGALFVDGAIIGEGIRGAVTDGTMAVTPGFGIRLNSPVGPIRLDLGVRPANTDRLPVVTEYTDENDQRRLVELETRRQYNPVEAAGGGFLNEVFSRLALHLSIGEAY